MPRGAERREETLREEAPKGAKTRRDCDVAMLAPGLRRRPAADALKNCMGPPAGRRRFAWARSHPPRALLGPCPPRVRPAPLPAFDLYISG